MVARVKVTDVRVRRLNPEGRMKAVASVTIDGEFVVHDVRVVEGHNGLFVAMPSRKTPDGEFRDIAHPITTDARERIQTAVLRAFGEAQAVSLETEAAEA
jgi:stage V sporulation protein G